MAESSNDLRKALADLNSRLEAAAPLDDDVRSMLMRTAAEIHALLDDRDDKRRSSVAADEGASSHPEPSIIDRLRSAERHFEESHPTLSGVVGSVIDALSRIGI